MTYRLVEHVIPLSIKHRVELFSQVPVVHKRVERFLSVKVRSCPTLFGIEVVSANRDVQLVQVGLHQAQQIYQLEECRSGLVVEGLVNLCRSCRDCFPFAEYTFSPGVSVTLHRNSLFKVDNRPAGRVD